MTNQTFWHVAQKKFLKKNTQDFRHLYQHQIVLKFHVLNFKILNLQCKTIVLNLIQLHLFSFQFSQSIILILMNLNIEKSNVEIDDSKFQLNLNIFAFDDNFVDVFIQKLWNQIETRNIFEFWILKTLRNDDRYHNKIPFIECEKRDNILYFRDKKYVLNSNSFRFRIIQLVHDSVTNKHLKRIKIYELVNRVYWWLNFYKYIKRFVRNCHVCTRIKFFRQKIQKWLRFLSISQRR